MITEIGGTVGDIESLPFLEAARQVRHDVGRDNVLLPARLAGAVHRPVRRAQDQADPALGRRAALDRHPAGRDRLPVRPADPRQRQAQDLADVRRRQGGRRRRQRRAVDLRHPEGAAQRGPRRLRRTPAQPAVPRRRLDRSGTTCCAGCTTRPRRSRVALVGKYVDLPDAYLSVAEALRAGGFAHEAKVQHRWVPSDECQTREGAARHLSDVDAVLRPRRVRHPRDRGQDRRARATPAPTASRRSGCASGCSAW